MKFIHLSVPAYQLHAGMIILEGRLSIHGARQTEVKEVIACASGCRKTHVNGTLCYEPFDMLNVIWPVEAQHAVHNRQERLSELQDTQAGHGSVSARKKHKQATG